MRTIAALSSGLPLVGSLLPGGLPWGASVPLSIAIVAAVSVLHLVDAVLRYKLGTAALAKVGNGATLAELAVLLLAVSGRRFEGPDAVPSPAAALRQAACRRGTRQQAA